MQSLLRSIESKRFEHMQKSGLEGCKDCVAVTISGELFGPWTGGGSVDTAGSTGNRADPADPVLARVSFTRLVAHGHGYPRDTDSWATSQRETARDHHIRAARFTTIKMGAAGSAILFSPVNNAVDRIIAFRFSIRLRSSSPPSTIVSFLLSFFLSSTPPFYRGIDSLYIGQQLRHRDGKSSRSISTASRYIYTTNDYVDQCNWIILNGIRFDGIKRFLLNARKEEK